MKLKGLENPIELAVTINEYLNPIYLLDSMLNKIYLNLHSALIYYEYAYGSVLSQHYFLELRFPGVGENDEIPDSIICSNAIAAYLFMQSCLNNLDKAIYLMHTIYENRDYKILSKSFRKFKNHIRIIRDRIAAHPEENSTKQNNKDHYVMGKRSAIVSDGRIIIMGYATHEFAQSLESGDKYELFPIKYLIELYDYLGKLGVILRDEILNYTANHNIINPNNEERH